MSAAPREKLYSPQFLALAASLAQWPLTGDFPLTGSARSRTCGSSVELGLATGPDDRITALGIRASACAVGQAAAAIFASAAQGHDAVEISAVLEAMELWLAGKGTMPGWHGMAALEPALDFPSRHGAILLPWKAARHALSMTANHG